MKLATLIIGTFIMAVGIAGCSPSGAVDNIPEIRVEGPCTIVNSSSLKLTGKIDEAMLNCVRDNLTPDMNRIFVNSEGGDVLYAHAIAYELAPYPRTLIIEDQCLSSCANYFIPAVHGLELTPGSIIGLHGTPDGMFLDISNLENLAQKLEDNDSETSVSARRMLKDKYERNETLRYAEAQYSEAFNVPLGWRLYREAGDTTDGWRRHFKPGSDIQIVPKGFMIVEETMLRTCLPNLDVNPFQQSLQETVFDNSERWMELRKTLGAYRSFDLACRSSDYEAVE